MSSLTTHVKIVYVPILYNVKDEIVVEGYDYDLEEMAIDSGIETVRLYVKEHDEWCYVKIEKRIEPIYE